MLCPYSEVGDCNCRYAEHLKSFIQLMKHLGSEKLGIQLQESEGIRYGSWNSSLCQ